MPKKPKNIVRKCKKPDKTKRDIPHLNSSLGYMPRMPRTAKRLLLETHALHASETRKRKKKWFRGVGGVLRLHHGDGDRGWRVVVY
jgi:hypothetical protein